MLVIAPLMLALGQKLVHHGRRKPYGFDDWIAGDRRATIAKPILLADLAGFTDGYSCRCLNLKRLGISPRRQSVIPFHTRARRYFSRSK